MLGLLVVLPLLMSLSDILNFNPLAYEKLPHQGYDVVAYFEQNKAEKGDKAFHATYKGTVYYFSSKENKEIFAEDPSRYMPQYDGYCAYSLLTGNLRKGDPTVYELLDGKLYFLANKSIKQAWLKDPLGNIIKTNALWSQVQAKLKTPEKSNDRS